MSNLAEIRNHPASIALAETFNGETIRNLLADNQRLTERIEDLERTVVMIGSRPMTVLTVIEDFCTGYTLCNGCNKPRCSGCGDDAPDREVWSSER